MDGATSASKTSVSNKLNFENYRQKGGDWGLQSGGIATPLPPAMAKNGPSSSSPSPSPRRIDFEIDHKNFADAERRYTAICSTLAPRNDGDHLLAWRAAWLSAGPYSEHWLYDAIAAVENAKNVRKPWAYLHRCLREGAKKLDRKFDDDAKMCPPLPKKD